MKDYFTKSLTELDGKKWPPPAIESNLVSTIHQLRDKPVGEFTIEDLRITIGQNIGLHYLVPLAIQELEQDPLAEGDMYPGDLLVAMLRVRSEYWVAHPGEADAVATIAARALEMTDDSEVVDQVRKFDTVRGGS